MKRISTNTLYSKSFCYIYIYILVLDIFHINHSHRNSQRQDLPTKTPYLFKVPKEEPEAIRLVW